MCLTHPRSQNYIRVPDFINKGSFTAYTHNSEPPWRDAMHGLPEFLIQLHCSDEYTCSL